MIAAAPEPGGPTCFCRDCLDDLDSTAGRCSRCGSPRLVRHPALPSLALAHIDCDAFYATVEKRDHPELADKPVIIGGGKMGTVYEMNATSGTLMWKTPVGAHDGLFQAIIEQYAIR